MVGPLTVLGVLNALGPFPTCGDMALAWREGRPVEEIVTREDDLNPGDLAVYGDITTGTTCFCVSVVPGRVAMVPEGGGFAVLVYASALRSAGRRFSGAVRLGGGRR